MRICEGRTSAPHCDGLLARRRGLQCRADSDGCVILDIYGGQEGQPQRLVNASAPFLYAAQDREGEAAKQLKPGNGFGSGHWYAEQGCGALHNSGSVCKRRGAANFLCIVWTRYVHHCYTALQEVMPMPATCSQAQKPAPIAI